MSKRRIDRDIAISKQSYYDTISVLNHIEYQCCMDFGKFPVWKMGFEWDVDFKGWIILGYYWNKIEIVEINPKQ